MEQARYRPRFAHTLEQLQRDRQSEKITADAYQNRLTTLIEEQLRTEEANSQDQRRSQLWEYAKQRWSTLEKEQQRLTKERQAEEQRLIEEKRIEEQRLIEDQRAEEMRKEQEKRREEERAMQPYLEYRDIEVPAALEEMRKRANRSRGFSNIFQLIIIATSTVAAGIVNIENIPRLVISLLTIAVALATGIVWIFKFKEKGINSQQTADAIEYQRNLYRLGIKDYAGKTPKEAHELFAERVEDLKNEQNKRQQLLEQTSDKPVEAAGPSKPA